MKFYILSNGIKQGPFSLEELANKDITPNTMVWSIGFNNWKRAKEVNELSELLSSLPPELPSATPMPKTWLIESIIVTCLCCLPFGVAGIINSSKVETKYQNGEYEKALHYSQQAKKWILWGIFTTLIIAIIYIIVLAIMFLYTNSYNLN